MAKLISTKAQRDRLEQCHPGVGFLVYNNGLGITEVEFGIHRKTKELCSIQSGKPLQFEVYDQEGE